MLVSDLYEEAKIAIGDCNEAKVLRYMSDAQKLLNNKGLFDATLAEMDICAYDGLVTLPAEVQTILSVNVGGQPTLMRDQWYQYHTNGLGIEQQPCGYSEELGQWSTFREPSKKVKIVAKVESNLDSNKAIRVYGWADGKRIYTVGASGTLEDGFLVPTIYGYEQPNPNVPYIEQIDHIEKAITNGFIKLVAIDIEDNSVNTTIGYYQPKETTPRYRRLHVQDQSWVRVKYKKTDAEIRSQSDWINCDNREAFILAVKAVSFRRINDYAKARDAEAEMTRIMNEAHDSSRPASVLRGPRIVNLSHPCDSQEGLIY